MFEKEKRAGKSMEINISHFVELLLVGGLVAAGSVVAASTLARLEKTRRKNDALLYVTHVAQAVPTKESADSLLDDSVSR
jgi:hypothetical protein